MSIEHSLHLGTIHGKHDERGLSLLELMFASLVMVIGLMGAMVLIATTIGNDNRSKWDSTATLLSQMTLETIASVPANATASSTPSTNLTINDCNPSTSVAAHSVNALGGAGNGAGAPLLGNGDIDFSAATVSGYSMQYYNCQASTGDRQMIYDVRWNIKTISPNAKLVTVSTQIAGNVNRGGNFFVRPVSLKMIVGL
jgi:Tfp pilus assembly protein PilV